MKTDAFSVTCKLSVRDLDSLNVLERKSVQKKIFAFATDPVTEDIFFVKVIPGFALRIPTKHDCCVISAPT